MVIKTSVTRKNTKVFFIELLRKKTVNKAVKALNIMYKYADLSTIENQ